MARAAGATASLTWRGFVPGSVSVAAAAAVLGLVAGGGILAPWLAAHGCAGAVASYAVSGALMLVSYFVMSLVPLWEMWRR